MTEQIESKEVKLNNSYVIEIDNLVKNELTPNQFILLHIVSNKNEVEYIQYVDIDRQDIVRHDLYTLYKKDYILNHENSKWNLKFSELEITQKGLNILSKVNIEEVPKINDFDTFMKEYFELWPEKVYSGNYLVKSNLKACTDKMIKFIKEYKYNKETILEATKSYIKVCKNNGWGYMKTAFYFIKKDSDSILAGYCEQIENNINNTQKETNGDFFTRDLQ